MIKKITTANNSSKREGLRPDVYDEKLSEDATSAHGWGYEVWINMDKNYGDFAIIRRAVKDWESV